MELPCGRLFPRLLPIYMPVIIARILAVEGLKCDRVDSWNIRLDERHTAGRRSCRARI